MMPLCCNRDGIGTSIGEVLWSVEEIQRAHGHLEIGLVLQSLDDAVHHGILIAAVHPDPAGVLKGLLHLLLASDDCKIHHVPEIALLVLDASRNCREDR